MNDRPELPSPALIAGYVAVLTLTIVLLVTIYGGHQ